jgi:hypothetical protein
MASSVCAGGGAVATVLGIVLVENCLHRWFERRLVLADGGELRQEVRVDAMFGSERRPAREKSYPGHLHYPGRLSTAERAPVSHMCGASSTSARSFS